MGSSRQVVFVPELPRFQTEWPELFEAAEKYQWLLMPESQVSYASLHPPGSRGLNYGLSVGFRDFPNMYLKLFRAKGRHMNVKNPADRAELLLIIAAAEANHGN